MKRAPVCKTQTPAVDRARASSRALMLARADDQALIELGDQGWKMNNV